MPTIRGVQRRQERAANLFFRDTRTLAQQLNDGLGDPVPITVAIVGMGVLCLFVPALSHFTPFVAVVLVLIHRARKERTHLPYRLPAYTRAVDRGNPKPGGGFHKAQGIVFIGNATEQRGQELWMSSSDVLTHELMLGATGAGKTENLVSSASNYLGMGGGLVFADAKAAPKLAFQIAALARRMGREDDLLFINYMTGNSTVKRNGGGRLTNTANPFASGNADSLTQIMAALIPEPSGDNAVFGERALNLVTAALYALVDLRDAGVINLGVDRIRDALNVKQLEMMLSHDKVGDVAKNAIRGYLKSLGWQEGAEKQPDELYRQHSFAQMYFTRSLSSLSDTYGHIYWTSSGEVDWRDVIMSRRIVVILLPALEKSPAELKNLAKININALRDAISVGLGGSIEGTRKKVIDTQITASAIPSRVILDEAGAMMADGLGFGNVLAQARGLGISVCVAGQDWGGFKRAGESEAEQIFGNTRIKTYGALEDPESIQRAIAQAGETYVTQTANFNRSDLSYSDAGTASLEKRNRIDTIDLQSQTEGQAHVLMRGNLVRAQLFFANPTLPPFLAINRFLKIGDLEKAARLTEHDTRPRVSHPRPSPDTLGPREVTDDQVRPQLEAIRQRRAEVADKKRQERLERIRQDVARSRAAAVGNQENMRDPAIAGQASSAVAPTVAQSRSVAERGTRDPEPGDAIASLFDADIFSPETDASESTPQAPNDEIASAIEEMPDIVERLDHAQLQSVEAEIRGDVPMVSALDPPDFDGMDLTLEEIVLIDEPELRERMASMVDEYGASYDDDPRFDEDISQERVRSALDQALSRFL